MVKQLPMPERVEGQEFARVVRTPEGRIVFVIDAMAGGENDPTASWGLMLVDLAHHVAMALDGLLRDEEGCDVSRQQILERIREFFDGEWAHRTDEVTRLTDA